jgi:dimethylamine monooxygenase subunit C
MSDPMHSTPIYQDYDDIRRFASSYLIVAADENFILENFLKVLDQSISYHVLKHSSADDTKLETIFLDLTKYLNQAKAGVHIVVVGDESFIWQINQRLAQMGCLKEERTLILVRDKKQVYCVHCGYQQDTKEKEKCVCEQCKVQLLIRSHFSERLGAYMGVCANANQPFGVAS